MGPEQNRQRAERGGDWFDGLSSVLADRRRRFVLFELSEHDEGLSVSTLVDRTVEWERLSASDEVDRTSVSESLRRVHIPKLVEADIVALDAGGRRVRLHHHGSRAEVVRRVAVSLARR